MQAHRVPSSPRRAIRALAAALALVALPLCAQAPAASANDEQLVEALLLSTAQSFRDKDPAAVRRSFAENCAGPLRIPKLARAALDQTLGAAQSVTADIKITETHIEAARALVIADISLVFEFGGGAREVKGPYLLWLDKGPQGWLITGVDQIATDWTPAEGSVDVHWPEDGVRFSLPKGWGRFPLTGPETHRSVLLVSPDLAGVIGVAVMMLPVPVQLQSIAAGHRGIAEIFPGSRFIDEASTTLAGLPAVATRMELAVGPTPTWLETLLAIRASRLVVLSRGATPATVAPRFEAAFAMVRQSLTVEPVADPTPAAPSDPKSFTNRRFGFAFPVPAGWQKQELDEATARKQGWAFGVHLRPAAGESYILLGGRELPKPVSLKALQEAEMKTVATIAPGAAAQDVKDLKVSGLPARSWVYTLSLGQERRRREVFMMRQNVLFFIIADAIPPADDTTVSATVDRLLETLSLAAP